MSARGKARKVSLALQGGGAHGAFTWGVLDRLLEEQDIEVSAISAASAGAMNAAAFKSGWMNGRHDGARKSLAEFWRALDGVGQLMPEPVRNWFTALSPPLAALAQTASMNPAYHGQAAMMRVFSPYQTNPLNFHPLASILEQFDFDAIRSAEGPRLHISATNVRTGKIRVFTGDEVDEAALLASGALPQVFQAVEIDDAKTGKREAFWDGGFMGNPALFPLFGKTNAPDVLIVHINPLYRDEIPKTAGEIEDRVNEISFNATLLRELRAIDFVQRLIEEGRLSATEKPAPHIHSIADDETMRHLGVATKMSPSPGLIDQLFDAGRAQTEAFLKAHGDEIGTCSTCDLRAMFQ